MPRLFILLKNKMQIFSKLTSILILKLSMPILLQCICNYFSFKIIMILFVQKFKVNLFTENNSYCNHFNDLM